MAEKQKDAQKLTAKNENPITGIIQVTGEPDTGKTDFALSCGYGPEEIFFVDDDLKSRAALERIVKSIAPGKKVQDVFPMYHDFIKETADMRELQTHMVGLKLIQEAQQKQPKVLIWDTWARFAKTCHPVVVKNPATFREFYSQMGQIKGSEQWQAAAHYEAQLYEKMLQAAPLVILVSHLKDDRLNGVKTGKQIPDASKSLTQKATLRLFLRHNPESPAPVGLVLKRIEKWQWDAEEGFIPIAVLPQRIDPCTWQKIREYWQNPIGARSLLPNEKPNAFELSIIQGTLTKDQMEVFRAGVKYGEEEGAVDVPNASGDVSDTASQARELSKTGVSNLEIAKQLSEKTKTKITVAQVIKWVNT